MAACRGCSRSWRGCATRQRGCPWDWSRASTASPPTRSRRPTRSPTPSPGASSASSATSSGTSCCRSSSTPAWPRRPAPSTSPTWCGRSPTRWSAAIRTSSAPRAATRPPVEQSADWERIKAAERAAKPAHASALDGVAAGLPALTRAVKLQDRAARVGFDWPDAGAVLAKVAEESAELVAARDAGDAAGVEEEYGDLMFVMANLARHLRVDPEAALRAANLKFTRRFRGDRGRARRRRPHAGRLRPRRDGRRSGTPPSAPSAA